MPAFIDINDMFRIEEIQEKLIHLVGWRQSGNPELELTSELTQSESGLYFEGAHPYITLENIHAVMPGVYSKTQFPEWLSTRAYKKGEKVSFGNEYWIAKKSSINKEPAGSDFNDDFNDDFGNPYWRKYNYFSEYIRNIMLDGIATVMQNFTDRKKLVKETKSILENKILLNSTGNIRDLQANSGRIVGIEINPLRQNGITAKINRVGLQMAGSTGTVKLYLFHSSQDAPIKEYSLEYTGVGPGFKWFELEDCYLPYVDENINAGGSWYICYDQDELPAGMQAINTTQDWSNVPCTGCNRNYYNTWVEIHKYMQTTPFIANNDNGVEEGLRLWNITQNDYTTCKNYGINLDITVGCDLTHFIVTQKHLFKSVIQRQVALDLLRLMLLNPSVNVTRSQSNIDKNYLVAEIEGYDRGKPGSLPYQLEQSYKTLGIDVKGMDKVCLTCNNHGVKYGTA